MPKKVKVPPKRPTSVKAAFRAAFISRLIDPLFFPPQVYLSFHKNLVKTPNHIINSTKNLLVNKARRNLFVNTTRPTFTLNNINYKKRNSHKKTKQPSPG